jgi:AcrR family transcriptional regulator
MKTRAGAAAPTRRPRPDRPVAAPPAAGTRERIVAAALDAFAADGYDGATTRGIAAAAGVNQGLIAYHFEGKEDLWKAAVDHVFEQLRQAFAAPLRMLDDVDSATRLRLVVRQFVRFTAAHPELHRLVVQEGKSDGPRQIWLVDRHIRPLFEATLEIIRRAQADGELAPIPAAHFHYIFLGAAAHIFMVAPEFRRLTGDDPMRPDSVEAHADALVSLLLAAPRGPSA